MTVAHLHRDYDRMAVKWQRARDTVSGEDAMRERGETYLKRLIDETDEGYAARVSRSDFANYTWRTINGLTGMAFRKPPTQDTPAVLDAYLGDIDMAGINLDALAEKVVEEVMEVGRCGLLVDHPPMPKNVTAISRTAAEELGLRPAIKFYAAETIRNWRFERRGNRQALTQVVLGECAEIVEDEFTRSEEARYRVLDLDEAGNYRQRVFKRDRDGKDILLDELYPLMRGKPLRAIPFTMIGASGMGDAIDEPPLIDLINANVAHYQVNSDLRHGLHFTGLPTLFLAGVSQDPDAKPFYIGGAAAITSPHPDAKAMFVEYGGQGLGAVEAALASLEKRMAVLGARMLADESRAAETLGATQIKRTGENSILARLAIVVSEAMEWALGVMADWAGAPGPSVYQINREFAPSALGAQQLTALIGAWQAGALSEHELFEMLQRGDIIDGEKDFELHQEEIDAAPLAAPPKALAA